MSYLQRPGVRVWSLSTFAAAMSDALVMDYAHEIITVFEYQSLVPASYVVSNSSMHTGVFDVPATLALRELTGIDSDTFRSLLVISGATKSNIIRCGRVCDRSSLILSPAR